MADLLIGAWAVWAWLWDPTPVKISPGVMLMSGVAAFFFVKAVITGLLDMNARIAKLEGANTNASIKARFDALSDQGDGQGRKGD